MVGADRSDQVHVPRAAHAGHLRSEHLGNLHGKRPHPSGRAVDQDLLALPNPSSVAETLQGTDGRHRHGRRLLERQVGRLPHQRLFGCASILGKGAFARAEHLVARLELASRFGRPLQLARPGQNRDG